MFAGTFDLPAATAVAADHDLVHDTDIVDLLGELITKSLLTTTRTDLGIRFRLLEPLRQYAENRLAARGESETARNQHLDYYVHWAEDWRSAEMSPKHRWRARLLVEFTNLRASAEWALQSEATDLALRLVRASNPAQNLYLFEVGDWAAYAIQLPGASDNRNAPFVAGMAAMSYWWRGDAGRSEYYTAAGEEMTAFDPSALLPGVARANLLYHLRGDVDGARQVLDRMAPREPWDAKDRSWLRAMHFGDVEADVALLRNEAERTGSPELEHLALSAEGTWRLRRGEFDEAAGLLRRAIAVAAEAGATFFVHILIPMLGLSAGRLGQLEAADLMLMRSSLVEQRDAGQVTDQWLILAAAQIGLWHAGHRDVAKAANRGLVTSIWADSPFPGEVADCVPELAAEPEATDPPLRLDDLVDRVLVALDEILEGSPPR